MILEVASFTIAPGRETDFQNAFESAQQIISTVPGFLGHQLCRCMETPSKFILLVTWRQIEDHTVGFKHSDEYQAWKSQLHHFFSQTPIVEHFDIALPTSGGLL